jgi:membrane-associated phospholipid phosphatase
MPALVAISRMYRGEHHPTDIPGSLLFSALWLTAVSVLVKPNAGGRAGQPGPGQPRKRTLASRAQARQAT